MAITLQGNWTVEVKSKASAFQQRFTIQGSENADGTHAGDTTTAPVSVVGAQWSITIEHQPDGGDWLPSDERLGYPRRSEGQIVFDIRSNDSSPDKDYNDLILTCTMPEAASEFVIYGRVRSYYGLCKFNPCFPFHLVIDTPLQLKELLAVKSARAALAAIYPERIREFEKNMATMREPMGDSEDTPFKPLMVPIPKPTLRPASITAPISTVKPLVQPTLRPAPIKVPTSTVKPVVQPTLTEATVSKISAAIGSSILPKFEPSVIDLAKIRDRFRGFCRVKNQPGLLLRFLEYDRTAEELSGGPYSGEGDRQILGHAVTDELGNYIFRFSRSYEDMAEEFTADIESGGPPLSTQLRPDLIVQVMGGTTPLGGVLFETALHSDVPNRIRINLCIPDKVLNPGPSACQGGRAIQAIGNIWTLPGHGNTLDTEGRITATHATGPMITRAAWVGRLDVFACFLDHPNVAWYTLRFRRPEGSWSFVQEGYRHIYIPKFGDPSDPDHKVGPFDQSLTVDGVKQTVPAYKNIESDPNWIATHRIRKIQLRSYFYAPNTDPGSVEFKIEGYDSAGNKVAGAEDTIILYIDNRDISGDIESIEVAGLSPGECALFELPAANEPIKVRFKAVHSGGFMQHYRLGVIRGTGTSVPVADTSLPIIDLSVNYDVAVHGDYFQGTPDALGADGAGYVDVDLQPTAGAWLPAGKDFCSFAFEVYAKRRVTNGYTLDVSRRLSVELVGISTGE